MKSIPNIDYGMLKLAIETKGFDSALAELLQGISFKDSQQYVDIFIGINNLHKEYGGSNDSIINDNVTKKAQQKPVGKYGNLANFLKERSGVSIDDQTLDKRLRTFFEDLITEVLKNPADWDRTRNINFMELFNYLESAEEQKEPAPQQGKEI